MPVSGRAGLEGSFSLGLSEFGVVWVWSFLSLEFFEFGVCEFGVFRVWGF